MAMLHFLSPMNQTCLASNQVVGGCEKLLLVLPAQDINCFAAREVTSVHYATPS